MPSYHLKHICRLVVLALLTLTSTNPVSAQDDSAFVDARERMITTQLIPRGIDNDRVLDAFRAVPRHLFVDSSLRAYAYRDYPLPIEADQTISQPYIVALMTQLVDPQPTDTVLEIGTGSGYQAAILAELCAHVFTIEIVDTLAAISTKRLEQLGYENVTVRHGDGYAGWPEQAPFDAIVVTAAPARIPQPLLDQLAEGGQLVIPVGTAYQELRLVTKRDGKIHEERITAVRFVPMTGKAQEED
ncbi:protein-L-isoaspartate(D-aspartate) O-methyltransferase [candidate division GN15 bacterium]|nr:protein-L-isoaspartate(D-aspartate) O-methyltransferase [candidate division GN15 bacterium]